MVLFLTDVGLPRDAAAAHLSNAIAIGIVSKLGFGWIADRMHPRSALLLDYGLLLLSSLVLLLLPAPGLVWLFVAAFGFATAARDVVTPLIVTHCFGVRSLPQIYGVLMLTLLPGGTLGPIFAGAVHDATGSYAFAFGSFAALNALSWLALTQVRDERGQNGSSSAATA
jgi:MFS family permease